MWFMVFQFDRIKPLSILVEQVELLLASWFNRSTVVLFAINRRPKLAWYNSAHPAECCRYSLSVPAALLPRYARRRNLNNGHEPDNHFINLPTIVRDPSNPREGDEASGRSTADCRSVD